MQTYIMVVAINGEGENVQTFAEALREEIIELGQSMSHGPMGTFDVHVTREANITPSV